MRQTEQTCVIRASELIRDATKQTKAILTQITVHNCYIHIRKADTSSIINYYSEMNNDQNARYFRVEGQLRYNWGSDQEIMAINNRRDKSPETSELVTRRIELAKPGAMRLHRNKNLGREIYVPRRLEENKEGKSNELISNLRRKKESHIGGGSFRDFGDEIPQSNTQDQTNREETRHENETNRDAESTTSNNSHEAAATQASVAYPAIPVQQYRDGPIEEIAVHYVRLNRIVEEKGKRN